MNKASSCFVLVTIGTCASVLGAETGDFDGDGRLTIRDVRNFMVPETCVDDPVYPLPEWEFAPGSDEAFRAYRCASAPVLFCDRRLSTWPASVYLEVLRRAVPDGLPSYSPMHWVDEWASAGPAPPLDVDERFSARLLSVSQSADDEDRMELEMIVTVAAPVLAFSLVIEAEDGMIRVPWLYQAEELRYWDSADWAVTPSLHSDLAAQGDLAVRIPVVGYLISGGRYVVTYGLRTVREARDPVIPPGEYTVLMPARLPRGTPAGTISLELLETSQVLFEEGVVAAPRAESAAEIVVDREVVEGWDEGVPPLRLDPVERRVLGEVRFRLADEQGHPAAPEQAVATGNPGDLVRFRVQVRTETPLNSLHFRLHFPAGLLTCGERTQVLLEDPEFPDEPLPFGRRLWRSCAFGLGWLEGWFFIGSSQPFSTVAELAHGDRAWEYFKPLGEWLDLMEFEVRIGDRATGDVPIVFRKPDRSDPSDRPPFAGDVQFAPYFAQQFCFGRGSAPTDPDTPAPNWRYDVVYEDDGFIRVGDPSEPPEPPGSGLFFQLGSATGAPGETVEVPVLIGWEPHVRAAWHTLAMEYDPAAVFVSAVDLSVTAVRTPDDVRMVRVVQPRFRAESEPLQRYCECLPGNECVPGVADGSCWRSRETASFRDSDQRYAAIRFNGYSDRPDPQPFEIARLLVEIQPEAALGTYELFPSRVPSTDDNGFPIVLESGAYDASESVLAFVLAEEVIGGLVHVAAAFRRGDSNQDGREDIADAVHALNFLFSDETAPPCLDSADVNDDGSVNITDPVFLLGALFGGEGQIPEPAGRCGSDQTDDRIGCEQSVCAE